MASEGTVIIKEIRGRSAAELDSLLQQKVEDLHKTKFKHALGQLRETHRMRQLKRDIARLRTVLRESQSGAQAKEASGAL